MMSSLLPSSNARFGVKTALLVRVSRPAACASRPRYPHVKKIYGVNTQRGPAFGQSGQWPSRLHCIDSSKDDQSGNNDDGLARQVSDSATPTTSDSEDTAVKIDLNADTRRTLLVQFTCDKCDTRSERLVNPEAYAKGTVFVQCQGCEAWHQLVDHMGLIKEYDLRDEATSNLDEQQK